MTNVNQAIPEKLNNIMKQHPEIKWTQVARDAILEKAERVELGEKLIEERVAEFRKFTEELRKKPVARRTPEEQKKAEKELETMSQEDLLRKFGLDKLPDASKSRRISSDDPV